MIQLAACQLSPMDEKDKVFHTEDEKTSYVEKTDATAKVEEAEEKEDEPENEKTESEEGRDLEEGEEAKAVILGQTFVCGDGSELVVNKDGTFMYYMSEKDHDMAYTKGTVEVYCGAAAIDYLASDENSIKKLSSDDLCTMVTENTLLIRHLGEFSSYDTSIIRDMIGKDDLSKKYVAKIRNFYAIQ